jgi:hypothetical protein
VKSKRSKADAFAEGAKRQSRAAFRARFAKNWLLAGEFRSADLTVPSGFTCTRTLMRTVPRMVLRAFSETSGITWCTASGVPELALGTAERGAAAGTFDPTGGLASDNAPPLAALVDGVEVAEDFGEGTIFGGAGAALSGAAGGFVAGAATPFEPDLAAVEDGGAELSALLRIIRGTISAASTSVPAAPIRKYFSEPLAARGAATRRGAAIVTFTFGSDDTGICDGAFPTAAFGGTGESGRESGSTTGKGASNGADCVVRPEAAPAADACAAAASGRWEAAALSGSG